MRDKGPRKNKCPFWGVVRKWVVILARALRPTDGGSAACQSEKWMSPKRETHSVPLLSVSVITATAATSRGA